MLTTSKSCTSLAQDMERFVTDCARALDQILLAGQLPPVVRGQRLSQTHRDKRPHMGGSSAENGSHYAAFLALLRGLEPTASQDSWTELDERVLKSVTPFLGQALVPFAHRAVLQSLAVYGPLETNALWQRLDDELQAASLKETFSISSYYDAEAQKMHTLPDNYLWITSENARLISVLLPQDEQIRAAGSSAFKRLVEKLREKPWFDDNPPYRVIDQYAWETVAEALSLSEHYALEQESDFLLALAARYRDALYKLVRADGYAFCWGRSQGVISYGTTISCLLTFGERLLAGGAISEEAFANDLALVRQCFDTLSTDWFDDDGLTTMHKHFRETFSYRRSHRLVGSTFGMLVKFLHMARHIRSLADKVALEPGSAQLPETLDTLLDFGADPASDSSQHVRQYGLWVGKNQHWHVTLPVVGNLNKFDPKVNTNYLPAPIAPFILDVPTQHSAPYGTEYIELQNGDVYAAAHGCDELVKLDQGVSLVWHRLLNIETLEYAEDIGSVRIDYRLDAERLSITHHFETERTDMLSRYSLLGVALKDAKKLGSQSYLFEGETKTLKLESTGAVEQLNVEPVTGLAAGKSFLGVLPWAVSLFLPLRSSRFSLELSLDERQEGVQ